MDNNLNKLYEHKKLGNTINEKVTNLKNYIEVLKQQLNNLQLRYRIYELQESFEKTTEVNWINQDIFKEKLSFYEKLFILNVIMHEII